MHTNDHQIRNYSVVLDAEFGLPGTPQRIEAEEKAYTSTRKSYKSTDLCSKKLHILDKVKVKVKVGVEAKSLFGVKRNFS